MSRKRKMTPAEKAAARWESPENASTSENADGSAPTEEEKPVNGDHFVISLVLIGVVAVAAIIFTTMQGGVPF